MGQDDVGLDLGVFFFGDPAGAPPPPALAAVIEHVVAPVPFAQRRLPERALLELGIGRDRDVQRAAEDVGRVLIGVAVLGEVVGQVLQPAHYVNLLRQIEDRVIEH